MDYKTITSYEAACADQGKDPNALPDYSKCDLTPGEEDFNLSAFMLSRILVSVNKDEDGNVWEPKADDLRYYLWFWWKDGRSGSRLSLDGVGYDDSVSNVASRLTCRDNNRARFVFDQFKSLWERMIIYKK